MLEVEGKILNIDPETEIAKLLSLGYRQRSDGTLIAKFFADEHRTSIRLRSEGDYWMLNRKVTSDESKKHEDGALTKARIEYETQISDPGAMASILESIGFPLVRTIIKRRRSFVRDGYEGHVEIDEYPEIPPLLEIEAQSSRRVKEIAIELGFPIDRITNHTNRTLETYYGVQFWT